MVGHEFRVLGLSSDGPPTVLRPGQSETIIVLLKVPFRPEPIYTCLFHMGAIPSDGSNLPIDWNEFEQEVRPSGMDDATWTPILARLKAQLGNTWGDYAEAIRHNGERWFDAGRRVYSVRQLFGMELDKAYGLPTGLIAGQVISGYTGLPVPNATVTAQNTQTNGNALALTWQDGSFALYGLAPGQCQLAVTGFFMASNQLVNVPTNGDLFGVQVLATDAGHIASTVRAASDNTPIASAVITLTNSAGNFAQTTISDGSGRYAFAELLAGTYVIQCKADGYLDSPARTVTVALGATTRADFLLVAGSGLFGVVTNAATGAPLRGATVFACGQSIGRSAVSVTDSNGVYQLSELPADSYVVEFTLAGYVRQRLSNLVLTAGKANRLNVGLTQGATLTGVVVNATNGVPITNALILVNGTNESDIYTGTTAAQGQYSIVGIPDGKWTVRATHGEFLPSAEQIIHLVAPQSTNLNFQLQIGSWINGTVTDTHGTPLTNVTVIAEGPNGSFGTGVSDTNGHFTIVGLGPGVHSVRADAAGYVPQTIQTTNLQSGQAVEAFGFHLSVGATVRGLVTEVDGVTPVARALVSFQGNNDQDYALFTRQDGSFDGHEFAPSI